MSDGFDPAARYCLHPNVAVRDEPFGALAYHHGSRRLTFLRSPLLADLVAVLGRYPSVDAAVADLVPAPQQAAYRRAIADLVASSFLHAC